ncbi:hypothetical protein [Lactobacillus sp. 3B(2020)]|uniref:hypothetical protein n=1 Tax=Lactobacillus sp. 3B(2020) TaxID=2695882 RepID=UPI0015DF928E|nr:hypothetical protein [Lactobacillus sp. 3B(2020)]QLL69774.1 hypothetical protein GTO83_04080 [Lactobacillus sp. 3B(2020)]
MTIEEAKAKLRKAYYLIEEVNYTIEDEFNGDPDDLKYVYRELDDAMLALDVADDDIDIELLHEREN